MISLIKLIRADKLRCICHVKEIKDDFAIKNSIKHSNYKNDQTSLRNLIMI